MTVCTIENKDGKILLDGIDCGSVNNAYLLYRHRYNKALGNASYRKYGHVGKRKERITSKGIEFEDTYRQQLQNEFSNCAAVKYYMLGMLDASYCRTIGSWEYAALGEDDEETAERYLDWLMCSGMHNARQFGRRQLKKKHIK